MADWFIAAPHAIRGFFDVSISNPPFGTRRRGIDCAFLRAGALLASSRSISLHNTASRETVLRAGAAAAGMASADMAAAIKAGREQHAAIRRAAEKAERMSHRQREQKRGQSAPRGGGGSRRAGRGAGGGAAAAAAAAAAAERGGHRRKTHSAEIVQAAAVDAAGTSLTKLGEASVAAAVVFELPRQYADHKRDSLDIQVDVISVELTSRSDDDWQRLRAQVESCELRGQAGAESLARCDKRGGVRAALMDGLMAAEEKEEDDDEEEEDEHDDDEEGDRSKDDQTSSDSADSALVSGEGED
jgi:predicted RNA methylase